MPPGNMTSKIPPPRTKNPTTRNVPLARARKNVLTPDAAALLKKRRNGLWAVGVAVIVAAGAIFGAQLKSTQQDRERIKEASQDPSRPVTAFETSLNDVHAHGQEAAGSAATTQEKASGSSTNNSRSVGSVERGASHDQRQISYLEERRGVLMSQKFELERKIERVREKKRQEEDLLQKRKVASVGDDR